MKNLIFVLISILYSQFSYSQTLAFPGAEGGGRFTTGGRGGDVYYVNSLADTIEGNNKTKEGTLRWCLKKSGPKTILFKVAGIIRLKSTLNVPANTTIAGQSAPGDGICIADHTVKIDGDNVIIRYIRFRMGDLEKTQDDALKANDKKNLIIDHCSMSWSTDECASFYDNEDFTLQWCILSESLRASVHEKGSHGYAGIWGGQNASFHHNLLAHHDSRNPRMCGSRYTYRADLELVDFRNNVIFNWGNNSGYAGEGGRYNIVNNYYKPSETSSNSTRIFSPNEDDGSNSQSKGIWGKFYLNGNYIEGKDKVNKDNLLGFQPNPSTKDKKDLLSVCEFNVAPVVTDNAEDAYQKVLAGAGANYKRDKTDERIVNETKLGLTPVRASGNKGTKPGLIDTQNDVGGWEDYSFKPEEVVIDSNLDGIPDGWLEKNYPSKTAKDINENGYTYLEVYLNELVEPL